MLGWTASSNASWLSATPSGIAPSSLVITVNPNDLAANSYNGMISLSAPGASNSPQAITVKLTVTAMVSTGTSSSLPHFATQGVWTTGIFVINTAGVPANFSIAFHDDAGNLIALPFGTGATNTLSGTLPALGSAYYEASNPAAALIDGWGQIAADPSIVIQALFREASNGTYYEAAVPSNSGSTEFEIPFDATTFAATGDQFYTGFAIANLDPTNPAPSHARLVIKPER